MAQTYPMTRHAMGGRLSQPGLTLNGGFQPAKLPSFGRCSLETIDLLKYVKRTKCPLWVCIKN